MLAEYLADSQRNNVQYFLKATRFTPRQLWQRGHTELVGSVRGYGLFDDTVLDKCHSQRIELVRRQYSSNAHGIIKGIGYLACWTQQQEKRLGFSGAEVAAVGAIASGVGRRRGKWPLVEVVNVRLYVLKNGCLEQPAHVLVPKTNPGIRAWHWMVERTLAWLSANILLSKPR